MCVGGSGYHRRQCAVACQAAVQLRVLSRRRVQHLSTGPATCNTAEHSCNNCLLELVGCSRRADAHGRPLCVSPPRPHPAQP